ncbi:MAG: hypothetical protein HEQ35_12305 [Gloeotrichia echinulata IR180]|jgi:hypothetical protein|nr:hypothetical protein [Gloeotrichia echinulata DEX184]
MISKINALDTLHSMSTQVELDLLAALLEPEDATYPWNPSDEESEAYFAQLEQQFIIDDLLEQELTTQSQAFYSQLDTVWSEISDCVYYNNNTNQSILGNLQENLETAFASAIPEYWLKAIAQQATEIFTSTESIGEQLIQCVQSVLPMWAAEDLLVLARPYAYAMRSSEAQNAASVISNLENRDWRTLSEIEQAKVTLAISYYALTKLNTLPLES